MQVIIESGTDLFVRLDRGVFPFTVKVVQGFFIEPPGCETVFAIRVLARGEEHLECRINR